MELLEEQFEHTPLNLAALGPKVERLELVLCTLSAADISTAQLRDAVLSAGNVMDVADGATSSLELDDTTWWFTESKIDGWQLIVTGPIRFMLVPCFGANDTIQEALDTLENRLPYLELVEPVNQEGERTRRGLLATAMALLQSLLPEEVD